MKRVFFTCLGLFVCPLLWGQQKIPPLLKDWEDWATWDEPHLNCPTSFNDANRYFCFCPSEFSLQAGSKEGHFSVLVTTYHKTWFYFPGDSDLWPLNVQDDGKPLAVVENAHFPAALLPAGTHRLTGDFRWNEIPPKIRVPPEYGVVSLSVEGKSVPFPNWDSDDFLWLQSKRTEEGARDFLETKVYRMIEDGIPTWLYTTLELSVSGKSREVELGHILPEGWNLSFVQSPLPVAVDDNGMVKARIRAGKWLVQLTAFRATPSSEFKMKEGVKTAAEQELICFKADPGFRMVEVHNAAPVDVSQTTFPLQWRPYPVYQWMVKNPLILEEKMRGQGAQSPKSLNGNRMIWLNEKGDGYVYRDNLMGEMQSIWRLDVPPALQLGSVGINGNLQLITRNPATGAAGVEIREKNFDLWATGTSHALRSIPATGWNTGLDSLDISLSLPPGWRMMALFGAESVEGDWLTSWTLLDLFILLIFSGAVYRLWGFGAGLIALFAVGLTYQEPSSPRLAWLFLILSLALLRVAPEGKIRKAVKVWKYLALFLLLLILIPFAFHQIQSVIYPQLEWMNAEGVWPQLASKRESTLGMDLSETSATTGNLTGAQTLALPNTPVSTAEGNGFSVQKAQVRRFAQAAQAAGGSFVGLAKDNSFETKIAQPSANLAFDPKAKIQTGPGIPENSWRLVECHWRGPVSPNQTILPILLSPWARKLVVLVELALIFRLLAKILGPLPSFLNKRGRLKGALLWIPFLLLLSWEHASAQQIPDKDTLETLKKRLLKPSEAYPHCAEISSLQVRLGSDRISYDVQIHAAIQTAVPLPGHLPAWSPLKVELDGRAGPPLRRENGYLWVVVPEGVHQARVEGLLPTANEWELNFQLKPRIISIEAPDWTVTGLRPDGTPEQQVFFARKQASGMKQDAAFDRREFYALAMVDRVLEIGLTWQIHNTVTRLSENTKAFAVEIPLLPGEQILSAGLTPKDGKVEVQLAANQQTFHWDSEMTVAPEIKLEAPQTDRWVERWTLISSPVWNVTLGGLTPVFESSQLTPTWHPWPGENVKLGITRPETVHGAIMTIHHVQHEVSLGNRSRNSVLRLNLQNSLGDDLMVDLPSSIEVTSVKCGDRTLPVRREGSKLVVPLQPGVQWVEIAWKETRSLGLWTSADPVILPVESANIRTSLDPPANRWILWVHGPLIGPAVRFWGVLAMGLLVAWILGRFPLSPLTKGQWALLMVGLTQINLFSSLLIVGWLFLLSYRGREAPSKVGRWSFNLCQIVIMLATGISLIIFLKVVNQGLLGNPKMFIIGNQSSPDSLRWYAAQSSPRIPQPGFLSVSVWFYRALMLGWALWLSFSLIRWLSWGWKQFSSGGAWRRASQQPPPIPSRG